MDYKQHKGNLRGRIKDKVERKLYNKQIRTVGKNVDTSERRLTIPDVSNSVCTCCNMEFSFLVNGLCFTCYSNKDEQTDC